MCNALVPDLPWHSTSQHGSEPSLLGGQWSMLLSCKWQRPEHIIALEGRSLVFSLRHVSRPRSCMHQRFLLLSDSMVNILGLSKGRTSARGLLRPCRQFCGIALRRDAQPQLRWLPSELNVADPPSRNHRFIPRWEFFREQAQAGLAQSRGAPRAGLDEAFEELRSFGGLTHGGGGPADDREGLGAGGKDPH